MPFPLLPIAGSLIGSAVGGLGSFFSGGNAQQNALAAGAGALGGGAIGYGASKLRKKGTMSIGGRQVAVRRRRKHQRYSTRRRSGGRGSAQLRREVADLRQQVAIMNAVAAARRN